MNETLSDVAKGELIDALLSMRSLLVEPGVWQQGGGASRLVTQRYAEDPTAQVPWRCRPSHPDAVQFCLVGAAARVTGRPMTDHPVTRYLTWLLRQRLVWAHSVQCWNDVAGRTVEEVLGLIDMALEELKS